MKALVLGATGFIGSHIARALVKEGIDVKILRRGSSPTLALEGLKVESVVGDLNDAASLQSALKGCDFLFHAAGYYPLYSLEKERQKLVAIRQMQNVLQAAHNASLSKVIYTSSMSTIGKDPHGPSNEDTPYDPRYFRGLYYEIKKIQEQMALKATKDGLPLVVVNPTGVFGTHGVKPTSGALIVAIAKKQLPALFDARMNVVDAEDVAAAQVAALKSGQVGKRYILGGHNMTVWDLVQQTAKIAGVPPPRFKLPLVVGEVGAAVSEILGKYVLRQEKPFLPKVGMDFLKYGQHVDSARAKKELNLSTTPLEATLEKALRWFKQHRYI